MGEVVYLFKKMTQDEAKSIIISNLKEVHHGKLVSWFSAVKGIKDWDIAGPALRSLIAEKIIEKQKILTGDARDIQHFVTMYRYNPFNRLFL